MTTYNVKPYAKQRSNSAIKNLVILSLIVAASYTLSFQLIKNAEANDLECGTNISLSDMQNALKSQSNRDSQPIPTGSISTATTKPTNANPVASTQPAVQQSTIQKKPIVPEQKAPQQSTIQKKPATKAKPTSSSGNSSVYTITTKEGHNILVTIEENGKPNVSNAKATKPASKPAVKPAPQINPYASVPAPTKKPSTTPIVAPIKTKSPSKPTNVTQIQPSTSTIYTPSSALQNDAPKQKKEKKSKRPIIVVVPPAETIKIEEKIARPRLPEPKIQKNYSEYGDPRWTDPSHTIINNYYLPQEEIEMMKQEAFNNPATTTHIINNGYETPSVHNVNPNYTDPNYSGYYGHTGYAGYTGYVNPNTRYYAVPDANYVGYEHGNGQYLDQDTGEHAKAIDSSIKKYESLQNYDKPTPAYYQRRAAALAQQDNAKPNYEIRAEERSERRSEEREGRRAERVSEERGVGSSFSTRPANSVEEALGRNDGSRVVVVKDY